jgi:hypothetical protein
MDSQHSSFDTGRIRGQGSTIRMDPPSSLLGALISLSGLSGMDLPPGNFVRDDRRVAIGMKNDPISHLNLRPIAPSGNGNQTEWLLSGEPWAVSNIPQPNDGNRMGKLTNRLVVGDGFHDVSSEVSLAGITRGTTTPVAVARTPGRVTYPVTRTDA